MLYLKLKKQHIMENENKSKESTKSSLTKDDIRISIEEAQVNKKNNNILEWEVIIISGAIGLNYKSWWIGGSALFVLMILTRVKALKTFFCLAFTVCWAMIGYFIGNMVENKATAVIFGIIAGFLSLGIHITAFKWIQNK